MSLVHLLLLILGIVLIVAGVLRIARWKAYVDGIVIAVLGLILLIIGGFISV